MRADDDVPLAPLTTLRLGGPARRLVVADRERDVVEVVRDCDARGVPLLVLGGGSNLVVADEGFDGTVLRIATRGREAPSSGRIVAAAGEPWDDFVAAAAGDGLAGVECLSGIPGLVGAVPMQNVGAYGQDVAETIVSLRAFDREQGRIVAFDREACRFAYRSSVFRGRDRWIILEVTFDLRPSAESRPIRYAELARALGVAEGGRAPLRVVRETVIALRRKKGMVVDPDDPDTRSAGSFFTNPIVGREAAAAIDGAPRFPEPDGRVKLSAAWLIERAGFPKGWSLGGGAAISSKHALSLTNASGRATTAELVALARAIREGVRARFGITLENEPMMVGVSL